VSSHPMPHSYSMWSSSASSKMEIQWGNTNEWCACSRYFSPFRYAPLRMDEPPAASFSDVNEHADEPFTAYRRHDIPHIAIIYPILSGEPLISANERAFVSFLRHSLSRVIQFSSHVYVHELGHLVCACQSHTSWPRPFTPVPPIHESQNSKFSHLLTPPNSNGS